MTSADMIKRARNDAVWRGLAYVLMFVPAAGVLLVSFVVTPEEIETNTVTFIPNCQMQELLRRPCPTCGMSRAFTALSHGEILRALRYNWSSGLFYVTFWAGALCGGVGGVRSFRQFLLLSSMRRKK